MVSMQNASCRRSHVVAETGYLSCKMTETANEKKEQPEGSR